MAALEGTRIIGITRSIIITVEEIAVLLEGGGEISAAAGILRTTTPITERTPPENTAGDERRGRVRLRGEEIAERTEEETEIEDEGILDLDLVRLLRRLFDLEIVGVQITWTHSGRRAQCPRGRCNRNPRRLRDL